jgi:hypothetical protein
MPIGEERLTVEEILAKFPHGVAECRFVCAGIATPLTVDEMAGIFAAAYEAQIGGAPSRDLLRITMAIIGLENANGKAIIQHNWGNVMADAGWISRGYPTWMHPKWEPGQPMFFRAYPSHLVGARDWWRLMFKKFRPVLVAANEGDAKEAVAQLYKLGYVVGGSRTGYANTVTKLADSKEYREAFGWTKPRARGWMGPVAGGVGLAGIVAHALFGRGG